MKLVVMSDTHLSRVTDEFGAICEQYCRGADVVVHLGDLTRSVILDYLEQYPLQAVAGNMDDHNVHSRLPVKKVLQVGAFASVLSTDGGRRRFAKSFENAVR